MLASTDSDEDGKKALEAISMTSRKAETKSHILPAKLRMKYMFNQDKYVLVFPL